jgi:hypothetical protein
MMETVACISVNIYNSIEMNYKLLVKNKAGQPQGDELGRIYPLSKSSFNCTFNSANSLVVILYGHLEIGAVLGYNSIVNSTS